MQIPRVVTIIGGGGKTSLMYYLLRLLKGRGYDVIGTTTTKLSNQQVSGNCFVKIQSAEAGYQVIQQARGMQDHVTLVYEEDPNNPGKIVGIPSEWINLLATTCRDTIFVVEGDGSAGKSLKGHLSHEPVIPSTSPIVIVVIGIDSVGAELTSQSVHRPDRICELTESEPGSVVTIGMITKLLFHPQGYLHNCPQNSLVVPFINKVESVIQHQQAKELAAKILTSKHPQVSGVIIGNVLTEEGLWLQEEGLL